MGVLEKILKKQKDNEVQEKKVILDQPEQLFSDEKDIDYVELELSVHPAEDPRMPDMERKQLEKELKDCSPIKKNDINITGIYAFRTEEGLEVSFFIRNGLERPVKFEITPLSIVDKSGKLLAHQKFELSEMGEVARLSGRPWKVQFSPENVFTAEVTPDDWKIIFEMRNIQIER